MSLNKLLYLVCFMPLWVNAQQLSVPPHFMLIDSLRGDLDKDGIPELVVVWNTDSVSELGAGCPRALYIYKLDSKPNQPWKLWKKSDQALLDSDGGGMMGDPFESLAIQKGILIIRQSGGSRWRWSYTDKYRYQHGAFHLIGYTYFSGSPCEYWTTADFNLSTGQINIKQEPESCEDYEPDYPISLCKETFFRKNIRITLETRQENAVDMITSPKCKVEFYL